MHIYSVTTPWLCICGVKEGTENSQVKSWSHQALDWKGPADTSLILTLSCWPLTYRGKEEAAEHRTFIAGSILTPAARTSHATDQQPVRSVGSKATRWSQDFIRYSEHAWHCNRIQLGQYKSIPWFSTKSPPLTIILCPSFFLLPLAPFALLVVAVATSLYMHKENPNPE